jgi:hypothetical protein
LGGFTPPTIASISGFSRILVPGLFTRFTAMIPFWMETCSTGALEFLSLILMGFVWLATAFTGRWSV